MTLKERLLLKVDFNSNPPHWIWKATKRDGYGMIRVGNKMLGAHRISFELFKGPIDDFDILHSCDIPSCINPDHLFKGTHSENMKDMFIKGRAKNTFERGEFHPLAKLNSDQVLEIRRVSHFNTFAQLARFFNVSETTIANIINFKTWKHLNPELS